MIDRRKSAGVKSTARSPQRYFGIDFVTSNTYIVAYDKTGRFYEGKRFLSSDFVEAFSNADDDCNVPTCVAFNAESADVNPIMLMGREAKAHPILHSFSGLKQVARHLTPPDGKFDESEVTPRKYPFGQWSPETLLQFGTADFPIVHSGHELLVEFFKRILHIGGKRLTKTL